MIIRTWRLLALLLLYCSGLFAQSSPNSCVSSTEGKEFWFGFMENRLGFSCGLPIPSNYLEVTVTSRFDCQFSITIGKSSQVLVNDVLQPNIPKKFRIDRTQAEPFGSETIEDKALHLVSDQPLNLYALNFGYNSVDAAVIFPVEALGKEYFAMCYEPHMDQRFSLCGAFFNGRNSEFVVVASEDQTEITITPARVTDKLKPAGVPFTVVLNKGELYQVQSLNLPNMAGQGDLTGTYIKSDKPVALYSGAWATTVPNSSVNAWDHLYEQIPPLRSWGRKFVSVPLKSRLKDTYRILASVDQTTVRISGLTTQVIDRGKFFEFMLNANQPALIESDHPVLLAQYSNSNDVDKPAEIPLSLWTGDGDPSMLIISPVDQTRENVTFVAYESPEITSKIFVNIITAEDAVSGIQLDNLPVIFTTLPGSGYAYAQVQIIPGNHNLNSLAPGKGFIAYVYGFGGVESYGYGVGFNLNTRLDLGGDIQFVKDTILLCNGATKRLDAGSNFSTFLWKPGGETTQSITVSKSGYYEVTATTPDGCVLTDGVHVIESNPRVYLGQDTLVCQKSSFRLDAGTGFASYLWSTHESSQTIAPLASGSYYVMATDKFGCQVNDTIQISIDPVPVLITDKLETLVCGNKSVLLKAGADKGIWQLSGSDPAVNINGMAVSVPAFGNFPMTFRATDQFGCRTDTSFTLGFHKIPAVNFSVNDSSCYASPLEVTYVGDANRGNTKFTWVFGTDTVANGIGADRVQLSLSKDRPNRSLYLKADESGCTATHSIPAIKLAPEINFTISDTILCEQKEAKLLASAPANSIDYLWDWGDGSRAHLGSSVSHLYTRAGQYDLQLTVTDDQKCSATLRKNNLLLVAPIPSVVFSIPDNQCLNAGEQILGYTGSGSPSANYHWDLTGFQADEIITDPGSSIGPLVFHLKHKPVATVSLQVTSETGCLSELKQLKLQRKPDFIATATPAMGCVPLMAGFKATLNDPVDQVDFSWDFGDGGTGSGTDISHSYLLPQPSPDVRIFARSATTGCRDTLLRKNWISLFPTPNAGFTVQKNTLCQTDTFKFIAGDNGPGLTYNWYLGDGGLASGFTADHRYSKDGYFDVALAVTTYHGCRDSSLVPKMVYAAPMPTVSFTLDPALCLNAGQHAISYAGSATVEDQFSWNLSGLDPADVIQAPGNTPGPLVIDLITKPSASIALQVVTRYGCVSEFRSLDISRKPLFSFSSDVKEGCAPLPVNFRATPGDEVDRISYTWNYGDGVIQSGREVNHIYSQPDQQYSIGLTAHSSTTGCTDSLKSDQYLRIFPNPVAAFSMFPEKIYNDQPDVNFTDKSTDALRFNWDFGDGSVSDLKNPGHTYGNVGPKKILQTVYNQYNCADTCSAVLMVGLRKLFTPNAICPNALNPVDREFKPYSNGVLDSGYHLKIYSRWNDVVFENRNPVRGWDGKLSNGKGAPPGNYIWILEFTDFQGESHRQMGTVMLVY